MYKKVERVIFIEPDELLNLDLTEFLEYNYDKFEESYRAAPQSVWSLLEQLVALRLKNLWAEENSRDAVDLADVKFTPVWEDGGLAVHAGWLVLENDQLG